MIVRAFLSLFLYRLLFILLLPVLIAALFIRSKNNPDYRKRITERLGILPATLKKNGIVIHAASVGEVLALKPFITQLIEEKSSTPITVTTFTPTGSAQVKKLFNDQVQHCYFPLDAWPCTWLFLKVLSPKVLVMMETEIWPNIIAQCANQGVKLQLINARLSIKSMKSYKKLAWLIKPALCRFDSVLAQSEDNKEHFIAMGSLPTNTIVSGNLKYDISITPMTEQKIAELSSFLAEKRLIWLVASTHPGDEALILQAFETLKKQHASLLLMLVPRHPERFNEVTKLCSDRQWQVVKRSENQPVKQTDDIWLIDTLGELLPCCALADLVTMGGSFSNIGGHNPLEPALFAKTIVVGHDMHNFNAVMSELVAKQAVIQLPEMIHNDRLALQIAETVNSLLNDENKRQTIGQAALTVVKANQGATVTSINALDELIS